MTEGDSNGPEVPRKYRSKTLDPSKTQDPFSLGTAHFYNFQKLQNEENLKVDELIANMDRSLFKLDGKEYTTEMRNLISDKLRNRNQSSPELTEFVQQFIRIYSEGDAWQGLSMYPPRILHPTPPVKTATFILVELLLKNSGPQATNVLKWIGTNLIPAEYSPDNIFKSTVLKACCVCHRKRRLLKEDRNFWALLDVRNHFYMFEIRDGQLIPESEFDVGSIALSRSKKTVKVFDKNGELLKRFIPNDPELNERWAACMQNPVVPLPLMFSNTSGPYPDLILVALNEALLSPDRLLLRALTHFNVSRVASCLPLAEAFFNIFSYAGHVSNLLVTLAGIEFSAPELQHNTVLRGNSHLTNMFKIFFQKFGRKYYNEFLNRVVMYIYSKGDLQLKTPAAADSHRAKQMVFTVINRICSSLNHIPPEMRHFASILKNAASIRFNSQQATYNTLSGFFCLRFISSIISNPRETDPNIPIGDDWIKILVPAAQLLMTPFNLIELDGKYDVFNSWNKTLREKIFPELIEFVFSVAVCEEEPVYQPCSKEKLRESLIVVMDQISTSGQLFVNKYKELMRDRSLMEGNGWSLATFITNYFEQNTSAPNHK
ncbi:GTPase-activator protein, putative [Trichomonas vaginalis G3]|uniref:GTPase-activator protein, putative n=1 Tax=Trichomonas vaginalis (strain ATCC PRA-98 / G3) TaxID=412133 RepID=A2EAY4_TRIV3|nr:GTPase activation domain, GAP family [Trichomonas vaginalis G3]EAY10229.1 GTPase-activator protein, putative [Trichomonas vaginalis G3]KAI5514017.1 GTPase activation domain, GAP family [Trichomonas vaginalis G3]|eukprot:XP_001322452.1 GTPase-activator protein [Trichomonas vaginalis G3]